MKRICLFLVALMCVLGMSADKYEYRTVPNDPLNTKIYTLPNGLQVFMSVNKDQPRIQTYIAVRVGGKNDPAETTGLAHYFEHLMFKGTKQFGTQDYEKEKPLLDEIESLFETYRQTTDSAARREIYHRIDSVSYLASTIAIPNEYDKLMSAIGANGTNAYTSYDVTCYVEDIPSNQIENWARIQADRFENPILRGFHTELETIYEEKNMSLTRDSRKVYEKMLEELYPEHPYGRQTVLGTQENLKNPSITNVKAYHKKWYVPNNMAIALAGDFDPDQMIDVITKYFGHLQPNPDLTRPALPNDGPLADQIDDEVYGLDAEYVTLAWRTPEAANADMVALEVMDHVMSNGATGILDLNVKQPQITLNSNAYIMDMADGGAYMMTGQPKEGQTLDDVREILLEQVRKLRAGDFSDDLVPAVVNNIKRNRQYSLFNNSSRADLYVNAFVNGIDWADEVAKMEALEKVTKEDVVAMANKYLDPINVLTIFKREGTDPNELKIAKPELTPIATNRDVASDFLIEIQNSQVQPIEPVFVDYTTDVTKTVLPGNNEFIYIQNKTNDIFELLYFFEVGSYTNPLMAYLGGLSDFIGTKDMTPEQVQDEFYKLACSLSIQSGSERTTVALTGLSENMPAALKLLEKVMTQAVITPEALKGYVERIEKSRANSKQNQSQNFSRLQSYIFYGDIAPKYSNGLFEALKDATPADIAGAIFDLNMYPQTIVYFGNEPMAEVEEVVTQNHYISEAPRTDAVKDLLQEVQPAETTFFIAPYDAKQLYMLGMANRGEKYNPELIPVMTLYNEYFGGSMNAIVFQEMRESRSLAYSAWAGMGNPSKADDTYYYALQIATQNDKLMDAINAFDEIINDMPQSESAFELAKNGLEARIRTERTINDEIAYEYVRARDYNRDHSSSKEVFEALPTMTLETVTDYQKDKIKDGVYYYGILGKIEDLDIPALEKLGKVVILTTEDIFGY